MRLLVLGYGSIVRRRVLPAARSLEAITAISVASRRGRAQSDAEGIAWFDDYDEALRSSGADAAYVSGVNTAHAAWVSRALDRGLHVMVDKPAFLDLASAEHAAALARRKGRALAEATVFTFHPQVAAFTALVAEDDPSSFRVSITFMLPGLGGDNFRYRAEDGGGCLHDLGPYAAAANRLFFRAPPDAISVAVMSSVGSPSVDTSFSMLLTHRHGGALAGHFGFDSTYRNQLSLLTRSRIVESERFFTSQSDQTLTLRVGDDEGQRLVTVPPADSFAIFLQAFADAVERDEVGAFEAALLDDARFRRRLREAAGV